MFTIYHNPRCKKSRDGLKYLTDNNMDYKVINYIKGGMSIEELKEIVKKLNIPPGELIRTQEKFYQENLKGKSFTDDEWIELMVDHPSLIKRPIVINETKAVLAQPPEKLAELY